MKMTEETIRAGEYAEKGDYHKSPRKNWPYYPVYLAKANYLKKFLSNFPPDKKILDLGCGEGVLVEEYAQKGYQIEGLDLNYHSALVKRGNLLETGLASNSFDLILCLDVLEHLEFSEQEQALKEIHRLLKSHGLLIAAIPNLAHLASRLSFLVTGKFLRTSTIDRHPGDRPIAEYLKLVEQHFFVKKRKGIFPTYPLAAVLTYKFPDRMVWWHTFLNKFLAYPNWCFLNIIVAEKKDE